MWTPIRCWLVEFENEFPGRLAELPDSEEAEPGVTWCELAPPRALLNSQRDAEELRSLPNVQSVEGMWCLYENVHGVPTFGVLHRFPCGTGMSGNFLVMDSLESALMHIAAEDQDARLLWELARNRGNSDSLPNTVRETAERALVEGDEAAIAGLASELEILSHPAAARVARIEVKRLD